VGYTFTGVTNISGEYCPGVWPGFRRSFRAVRSFLFLYVLLLFSIPVRADRIYVDPTGAGDTITIQAAVDRAYPGDTILIHSGVYMESVELHRSGTETAPIILQPFGDGEVIVDGNNGTKEACILARGVSHVTLKELTLRNASIAGFYGEAPAEDLILEKMTIENIVHNQRAVGYGIYFYALPDSISFCQIKNCEIRYTSSHGIFLYGRNHSITIKENHVSYSGFQEGAWGHAVKTVVWNENGAENGPEHITIENNQLEYAWTQGIMTWNARDVIIRGNHIHHCGATGIQIEDGTINFIVEDNLSEWNQQRYNTETGIWIDDAINGVVRNNIVRHNQVGIKVSKSDHVILRNNLLYDCRRENPEFGDNGGIYLLAYDGIDNRDIILIHNTLSRIGTPGYWNAGLALVEYGTARITGTVFKNNIMTDTYEGFEYVIDGNTPESDSNDLFNPAGIHIIWNGFELTWEEYRALTEQDGASIVMDPLFHRPDSDDFRLSASSPCIDAGGSLTETRSDGIGTILPVLDVRPFTDGFGIGEGDTISIGGRVVVRIMDIDYLDSTLTLDREITWVSGEKISFPYLGSAPDMGAMESRRHPRPF